MSSIWCREPNDCTIAGESGLLYHYGHGIWTKHNAGTHRNINALWGTADGTLFAGGDGGLLLRRTP